MKEQVTVYMPAQLQRLYETQKIEAINAATVAEVVAELGVRYPGINERLTEPNGSMRRWVNVFVDREDIRGLQGIHTQLQDGAEVHIVPSVMGG